MEYICEQTMLSLVFHKSSDCEIEEINFSTSYKDTDWRGITSDLETRMLKAYHLKEAN